MPLLASPMFALGAQEFLALATKLDEQTGETSRRNIDAGIMSDFDVPGLQDLPLVTRAREVLRYALRRVGRDSFAAIARDVVNASGWFVRLAQRGPEGKAIAANVLKALDAVAEAEAEFGNSPRSIALAFDRFLAGKEAPGPLNEEGDGAVRIMNMGNLPFTKELRDYHMGKIAERAAFEHRKATFQMVTDDVYAISKGRLVGRPR